MFFFLILHRIAQHIILSHKFAMMLSYLDQLYCNVWGDGQKHLPLQSLKKSILYLRPDNTVLLNNDADGSHASHHQL
jgi:hypothetical protein